MSKRVGLRSRPEPWRLCLGSLMLRPNRRILWRTLRSERAHPADMTAAELAPSPTAGTVYRSVSASMARTVTAGHRLWSQLAYGGPCLQETRMAS